MPVLLLGLLARHLLTGVGAVVVEKGITSADEATAISGAVATLVGLLWSAWQKKRAQA